MEVAFAALDAQVQTVSDVTGDCPYHGPLLCLHNALVETSDQSPMERFLAEGSGEQPFLCIKLDGVLSISKTCTCWMILNAAVDNKMELSK